LCYGIEFAPFKIFEIFPLGINWETP